MPEPPRAPAALGRILHVVRKLIDYGRQLSATVQQRALDPGFALFVSPFGTVDLAVILARITAGLRLAAALEARLVQRAGTGRDLTVAPLRIPVPRPSPAIPQAGKQDRPLAAPRTTPAEDPRLPTEEEIAAEVRRRPVGAVIADICRDLGIAPGRLDRTFWDEICVAIISYGGSLPRFTDDLDRRLSAVLRILDWSNPACPTVPPNLPAPATGPP